MGNIRQCGLALMSQKGLRKVKISRENSKSRHVDAFFVRPVRLADLRIGFGSNLSCPQENVFSRTKLHARDVRPWKGEDVTDKIGENGHFVDFGGEILHQGTKARRGVRDFVTTLRHPLTLAAGPLQATETQEPKAPVFASPAPLQASLRGAGNAKTQR